MPPLKSWLPIPLNSDFTLHNLPLGIITSRNSQSIRRPATRIGNHVLDLQAFSSSQGFSSLPSLTPSQLSTFSSPTLNAFAKLGQPVHRAVRGYLQEVFRAEGKFPEVLEQNEERREQCLLKVEDTKCHLMMDVGDYTDFFAGVHHARNAGTIFRGPENALQPNYHHLPVGYHGRSSSIVISGTPITRPHGQILLDPSAVPKKPIFAPTRKLDMELELGCFLCDGNELGQPIPVTQASEKIFGYVLLNDWSARDIQNWEYVPLGPFNGKNFASTVSGWVVLFDALEPFRCKGVGKDGKEEEVLEYLREDKKDTALNLNLEIDLITPEGDREGTTIEKVNAKDLMWSFEQMLAHQSAGGCNMRTGDLFGSGTISGEGGRGNVGSLLEETWNGRDEVWLKGMEVRRWLADGDEVVFRGWAGGEGEGGEGRVGFGECRGRVVSAVRR
ncbi:putative fumarylacetoacetate hydrolase protein [Rutstroemia sp. NJR-2017a WRK4]|nr:putative fumarylacetoacetate hydrolase protein [Rutstroemia sp. NJR-2017a WRK4]